MAQTLAILKYPPLSIGEATHTLHLYQNGSKLDKESFYDGRLTKAWPSDLGLDSSLTRRADGVTMGKP